MLWTVTSIALMLALWWWSEDRVAGFLCVAAWGFGALPSIVYAARRGLLVLRPRPDWLRANRTPARHVFLDFALTQATSQGATLVIAALTGAVEMGLIRKAQIWLGPATVATLGLLAALQPVLTRLAARHGRAAVIRMAAVAGLALGGLLGVFGIAVLLLPDDVAELLVGPGWDEASQFVAPLTVSAVMGAVGGCLGLDAAHAGSHQPPGSMAHRPRPSVRRRHRRRDAPVRCGDRLVDPRREWGGHQSRLGRAAGHAGSRWEGREDDTPVPAA